MIRKLLTALVVAGAVFALSPAPAQAAVNSYGVTGYCQVNSTHYLNATQYVTVYSAPNGNTTHFNTLTVSAPGATEIRASIRTADGTIVNGPRVGYQSFNFTWSSFGTNVVSNSLDPRVRVYYYYGAGCNVILNPPNS